MKLFVFHPGFMYIVLTLYFLVYCAVYLSFSFAWDTDHKHHHQAFGLTHSHKKQPPLLLLLAMDFILLFGAVTWNFVLSYHLIEKTLSERPKGRKTGLIATFDMLLQPPEEYLTPFTKSCYHVIRAYSFTAIWSILTTFLLVIISDWNGRAIMATNSVLCLYTWSINICIIIRWFVK